MHEIQKGRVNTDNKRGCSPAETQKEPQYKTHCHCTLPHLEDKETNLNCKLIRHALVSCLVRFSESDL